MPNLYMTVCFNTIILDLFLSYVIFFYEFCWRGGGGASDQSFIVNIAFGIH